MSLEVPVLWLVLSHQMVVVTANVSIMSEEMWRFVNFLFSLRRGVGVAKGCYGCGAGLLGLMKNMMRQGARHVETHLYHLAVTTYVNYDPCFAAIASLAYL